MVRRLLFGFVVLTTIVTGVLYFTTQPAPATDTYVVKTGAETDSTSYGSQRKLAVTSDGHLHAVYHRKDAGGILQIYHAESADEGQTWSEEQITYAGRDQLYPALAVDSNDGLHLVWQDDTNQPGTVPTTYYRKKTTSWQPAEWIASYATWPAIAVDSNDDVHVVYGAYVYPPGFWGGGDGIRWRKRTSTGWQPEAQISSSPWSELPAIAIDADNDVHVVWNHDPRQYYDVHYRERTSSGWQTEVEVNAETTNEFGALPSLAIDADNHAHIVWRHRSGGSYSIKYREYTGSLGPTVELEGPTPYPQDYPVIAMDAKGHIHVAWHGQSSDSPTRYQIRRKEYSTSWQATENLTSSVSDDQMNASLLWAFYPTVDGLKTNQPNDGYALIWMDGTTIVFAHDRAPGFCLPYADEDQLRDETRVDCRSTFVLDSGIGSYVLRDFLLEYAGLFEVKGWSKNFLWYAYGPDSPGGDVIGRSIMEVAGDDPRNWSYCVRNTGRNGAACRAENVRSSFSISDLFGGQAVTLHMFAYDDPNDSEGPAFISRVCGNYSETRSQPVPKIKGTKFHDLDRDGVKDPGEPGLGGWFIRLLRESSLVGEPTGFVDETQTAPDGSYAFELLGKGPGTYNVEEVGQAMWEATTPTSLSVIVGFGIGDRVFGESGEYDFGNRTVTPTLTVVKVVDNSGGGSKTVSDFTLRIDGGVVGSGVAGNVVPGLHIVSEDDPAPEYTAEIGGDCAPDGSVTVGADENKICTVTNAFVPPTPGEIIFCKDVVPDDTSSWDVTLTGPSSGIRRGLGDGECSNFSGILPGTYTVSETTQAGYGPAVDCASKGSDTDNDITFALGAGEAVTCTFTNTKLPNEGTITICKDVVPDDASQWEVRLDGPVSGVRRDLGDGECQTFGYLPSGAYTVSETTQADYDPAVDCGSKGSEPDNDITFSFETDEAATCTFTNTFAAGPPAVGGIVEIRSGPSAPAAQQPGSAAPPYAALAGAAAAGALALMTGAWYARRRWPT